MVPLDSSLFWAVSEPWTHRGFLLPAPGQRRVPPRSPCARRGAPMCSREKVAAQHGWGLSALASTQEHEESYIVLRTEGDLNKCLRGQERELQMNYVAQGQDGSGWRWPWRTQELSCAEPVCCHHSCFTRGWGQSGAPMSGWGSSLGGCAPSWVNDGGDGPHRRLRAAHAGGPRASAAS